jgi:2-keto-4-pentenoate hydratase
MGTQRLVVTIDSRLHYALTRQFDHRRTILARGVARVGWKIGAGHSERVGDDYVIGFLMADTLLVNGGRYCPQPGEALHVDVELACSLAGDIDDEAGDAAVMDAVTGFATALEVVDLSDKGDPVSIVSANIFHRAVVFGETAQHSTLPGNAVGSVLRNGVTVSTGPLPDDIPDRVRTVGRTLHAMDERLMPGDRIITGSIVQVPVNPGDLVATQISGLEPARLRIGDRSG